MESLLAANGQIMGVLELRLARGGLTCAPVELARQLEGLAKHIALAICKPTLYDRAVVDALTGLYTKRHFLEQVQQYMAQRTRLGTPLSMIILDVASGPASSRSAPLTLEGGIPTAAARSAPLVSGTRKTSLKPSTS